jgi:superfamily II DNA or RNA helicase
MLKQPPLVPTDEQQIDAGMLVRQGAAGLFNKVGTGKTLTAITALKMAAPNKTLIIVPQVALAQWAEAIIRQGFPALVHVLRTGGELKDHTVLPERQVVITTWKLATDHYDILHAMAFDCVILDESQNVVNPEALRTRAVYGARCAMGADALMGAATYRWVLSGTPMLNYAEDLWATIRALWPEKLEQLVGSRSFLMFQKRYCVRASKTIVVRTRRGKVRKTITETVGSQNEDELWAALQDVTSRRVLTLPPWKERSIEIAIDGAVMAQAEANLKDVDVATMADQFETPAIKSLRRAFGVAKIKAAAEYLGEIQDEPVVIMCWHRDVIDALAGHLGASVIDGSTTAKRRDEIKASFMAGDINHLVGQIGAMGTALDGLQTVCRRVAFVERIGSPAQMEQAIGRIWRRGQGDEVQVEYLRAHHRLEEATDLRLSSKRATQHNILDREGELPR